jgi:CubicO group peptidase (beta-lactamase class C family)
MDKDKVITLAKDLGAYSFIVNKDNNNIIEFGDTADFFNVASIRKCFLSALYGIRVAEGKISLSSTLEELGINDIEPSLTTEEKQATIEDLLKLRSGVYHPANYETASAKAEKPTRGSHPHNTFWYYNNWDANVLGTIYRQLTAKDIFQDYKDLIANPIGMEDFDINKCEYKSPDENSLHPAYIFRMSARDLVKFGLLYLNKGRFNEKVVIPETWVDKSLHPYSLIPNTNGFGYMWEVSTNGKLYGIEMGNNAFAYSGFPGHFIVGIPSKNMVIVYVHNLDLPDKKYVETEKFAELIKLTLA